MSSATIPAAETADETARPVVLVVDDDPTARLLAVQYLELEGLDALAASNGREACALFEVRLPDCVLLDVMMPGMNGFSCCSALRMMPGGERTPVIMMTNLDDYDSIEKAYQIGATDFAIKPINWTILAHHIRYILRANHAFENLRRSEAKNRALLNAIPDTILRICRDGTILDHKPARGHEHSFGAGEIRGRQFYEVMPRRVANILSGYLAGTEGGRGTQHFQFQSEATGERRHYEIRNFETGTDEILSMFRDVTKEKRLEEEVIKKSKMESIGVLAGGIAHDFNNLLVGILGNVSLLQALIPEPIGVQAILESAETASLKAKDLVARLLTFSHGGTPVKKPTAIGKIIEEAVELSLRGSRATCDLSIADGLRASEVDETQILQVLSNLVINADQAMPEGGAIRIRAENAAVDASSALPLGVGAYVKISVRDQGIGIPEEHLVRIFDPFFTTKQKGSGLGLATAYSIVDRHNGCLTVDSELGRGSTFSVYLPAVPVEPQAEADDRPAILPGKGRVLLMDDEDLVRETAGRMLSHLGYEVTVSSDGSEAIDLFLRARQEGRPFDLVILDLTVPGSISSREIVSRLQEIDPGVHALVSSGYSSDPVMADPSSFGFRGIISKPYRMGELSRILRDALQN